MTIKINTVLGDPVFKQDYLKKFKPVVEGNSAVQRIVNYFFKVRGWDLKGKEWIKKNYGRYAKEASELYVS